MLHPITQEFLSKANDYDRLRQREVCQLRNSVEASESASPSEIQEGTDLFRFLLLLAGKRLREAKIAFRTRECGRRTVKG